MCIAADSILAAHPVNLLTMAQDPKHFSGQTRMLAVFFRGFYCHFSLGNSVPDGGRDREGAGQPGSHYTGWAWTSQASA